MPVAKFVEGAVVFCVAKSWPPPPQKNCVSALSDCLVDDGQKMIILCKMVRNDYGRLLEMIMVRNDYEIK